MFKKEFIISFFVLCGFCFGMNIFGNTVEVEKYEYFIEKNTMLEINAIHGEVKIESWKSDKIYVEVRKNAYRNKSGLDKIRAVVENKARKFKIYTEIDDNESNVGIDYIIKIPKNLKSLEISIESGDIDISGVNIPVNLYAVNGSIEAEDVGFVESVSIKSGDIDISNADSIKKVEALNGNIELKNIKNIETVTVRSGDINIYKSPIIKKSESKNGNIEIENDKIIGETELISTNGNIELKMSAVFEAYIDFSTINGDIDIDDFDVEHIDNSRKKVEGKIGKETNKIIGKNINGSIELSIK